MSTKPQPQDLGPLATVPMLGSGSIPATPPAGQGSLYGIGTSNINFGFIDEAGTLIPISTGLRAWTAWTPGIGAASGTFTTTSSAGRYIQIGKTVHFQIAITITTVGTGSGLTFTLPVTAQNLNGIVGYAREDATSGKMGVVKYQSTTVGSVIDYANGNIVSGGNGSVVKINGTYEAA